MANVFCGGPIMVHSVGSTQATGAASARIAIPVDGSGGVPKYIRVSAINESYVKLGDVTVVATTNDVLIQPADAALMSTNGRTHIAFIQGTAAGKVNILPLDNV